MRTRISLLPFLLFAFYLAFSPSGCGFRGTSGIFQGSSGDAKSWRATLQEEFPELKSQGPTTREEPADALIESLKKDADFHCSDEDCDEPVVLVLSLFMVAEKQGKDTTLHPQIKACTGIIDSEESILVPGNCIPNEARSGAEAKKRIWIVEAKESKPEKTELLSPLGIDHVKTVIMHNARKGMTPLETFRLRTPRLQIRKKSHDLNRYHRAIYAKPSRKIPWIASVETTTCEDISLDYTSDDSFEGATPMVLGCELPTSIMGAAVANKKNEIDATIVRPRQELRALNPLHDEETTFGSLALPLPLR